MSAVNLPEEQLEKIVSSITSAVSARAVYVFGSYARGEEGPESDLDLYVVVDEGERSRFESAGAIGRSLLWMGMPKDIVVGSAQRFASRMNSLANIEYVVAREGVKIYG